MTAAFRCGVRGLPAAETLLLRTLFRLYQHGASDFRWTLVDAAPYDALLVDANAETADDNVQAILTLGSAALAGMPNALARPLRSEMLEAWLLSTQRELLAKQETAALAAPVAVPAEQPAAAPAAMPAVTVPVATAAQAADGNANADTYKLTRWPPAAMLRNDPSLIRMATVLSRRAMTIAELARVSQQPADNASMFVMSLRDASLLVSNAMPRPLRHAVVEKRPSLPHRPQKIERGLLNRIRVRLGL